MDKKINKLDELMKNTEFVYDILNTNNGLDLIKKFSEKGIDLNQITFSELCKMLVQKIQIPTKSDELNLVNKIAPTYNKMHGKMVFKLKDQKR